MEGKHSTLEECGRHRPQQYQAIRWQLFCENSNHGYVAASGDGRTP